MLVPDVLPSTPPFIDTVQADSVAEAVGLQADDLIVYLNGRLVRSCKQFRRMLGTIEQEQPVTLTILRDQALVEATLQLSPRPE